MVGVGLLAGLVMASFLWIYPVRSLEVPLGWDTSEYLWRTAVTQEVGVAELDQSVPLGVQSKTGRPAFPVILSILSSLGGVTALRLSAVLPMVLAAAIGLAAGAFVGSIRRGPSWEAALAALLVGLSPFVIRLMAPEAYFDNLLAAAVFMTAAIATGVAVEDRRAVIPAILLFSAAGIVHWTFLQYMAAVLLLAGGLLLPWSWARWRSGDLGLLQTPSARIGQVLLGGGALAGAMIYGVVGDELPNPRVSASEFARKLRRDVWKYRFPIALPLAGLGLGALAAEARRGDGTGARKWFALAFLLAWCGVAAAGFIAHVVFGMAIPSHRFLAFALSVPMLGAWAVIWLARLAGRRARPLGVIVGVVFVLGTGYLAETVWTTTKPWMDPVKMRDASNAASYLDAAGVSTERPVVFIVSGRDWNYAGLMVHMIRAALPVDRVDDAYLYVGSPGRYLARRPEDSRVSRFYFQRMESTYEQQPVAVMPASFNEVNYAYWIADHPETVLAARVSVIKGPEPRTPVPPGEVPIGPFSPVTLGLLAVGSLGALGLAGLGWTLALLGRWLRRVEIVAAAPAVGIGALAVGGIVADRLGVRLVGWAAVLTATLITITGWAVFALTRRAKGRDTGGARSSSSVAGSG
jgi:hypothetical protein